MFRPITIIILSLAFSVQAGEVKITETETGIIAEYTGSPASTGNDGEIPAAAVDNDNASMVDFIKAQIDDLKKESAEIKKLTGNETEDELAIKKAQADAKNQQIKSYSNELSQLIDLANRKDADVAQPEEEQLSKQQDYSQEKKRPSRGLKKPRKTPPPSADPHQEL